MTTSTSPEEATVQAENELPNAYDRRGCIIESIEMNGQWNRHTESTRSVNITVPSSEQYSQYSGESPRVFISYTHDSDEHKEKILSLADRLVSEGIDCHIDRYYETPPPAEGWAEWMIRQIENADFVLLVCTEIYHRRFRRQEQPDRGLGAQWEGATITQTLYNTAAQNTRFIPIGFTSFDLARAHIPVILQSTNYYDVSKEEGYLRLYRHLTNQPEVQRPQVGRLRALPTRPVPVQQVGTDETDDSTIATTLPSPGLDLPLSPINEVPPEAESLLEHLADNVGRGGPGSIADNLRRESSAPQDNTTVPSPADEAIAQTRIEATSRMLKECRAEAASIELRALRSEMWNRVSVKMRAKILNNEGVVALQQDDLVLALRRFEEALGWDPTNVKIISNVAQVALLTGRYQEALEVSERALAQDAVNETAASVYLQALNKLGSYDKLESVIAEDSNRWMAVSSVACRAALAAVFHERGDYARAEELIRAVITGGDEGSDDPQHYMLLGSTIVASIQQQISARRCNVGELTPDEKLRLAEAEEKFSQGSELFQRCDRRRWFHLAILSRASIRYALANYDDALRDCERILNEDENNRGALQLRGQVFLHLQRADDAVKSLEAALVLSDQEERSGLYTSTRTREESLRELRQMLCEAYLNAGQPQKVLDFLGNIALPSGPVEADPDRISKAEFVLYAASQLQDENAKEAEVAAIGYLRLVQGEDDRIGAILSNYYDHIGDIENAIVHQRAAIAAASEMSKPHYELDLAGLLFRHGRYEEAAGLLRSLTAGKDDHAALPMLANSLFNAGLYSEALETARRVRTSQGVVSRISEIEAEVLERAGDLDAARDVWAQLINAFPTEHMYKARAAFLELRAGRREDARRLADLIPYAEISSDVAILMNVARLRQFLDLPDVLRYGYRARRIAFGDPEVHAHYMKLCFNMNLDSDESVEVLRERDEVSIDDAVTLVRDGNETTFILENEEPVFTERGEVRTGDARATRLLGRRKGESVVLRESILGPEEYTVKDIKSKYLHGSHETTEMFKNGLLEHPDLGVMDVSEPEFMERFWRFMDRRSEDEPYISDMYRAGSIPLSMFARFIHRSVLDVWLTMSEWAAARIFAFRGTQEDMDHQKHLLADDSGSEVVSLDLLTLLTIVHLGLEQAVQSRFRRVLVARPLVDELREYELEVEHGAPSVGTVGSIRGRRFFIETPPQELERRKGVIRGMLRFIDEVAEVVPVITLLEADPTLRDALGDTAVSAVIAAKEQGAILYSDDLPLRDIALEVFGVAGVDTQGVLTDVHMRNIVTDDARYAALGELARIRYHFVSIGADGLISLLEQDGFSLTAPVRAAFDTLEGPESDQESAILIVSEVIKRVWLMRLLPHQKYFVLDIALPALVKGRRSIEVINRLLSILPRQFYLVTHIYPEVRDRIKLWVQVRTRTIREG